LRHLSGAFVHVRVHAVLSDCAGNAKVSKLILDAVIQ